MSFSTRSHTKHGGDTNLSLTDTEFNLLHLLLRHPQREPGRNLGALLRVGHPPETLKHIFDCFYRGDDKLTQPGFGLGHSIAKYITESMRERFRWRANQASAEP